MNIDTEKYTKAFFFSISADTPIPVHCANMWKPSNIQHRPPFQLSNPKTRTALIRPLSIRTSFRPCRRFRRRRATSTPPSTQATMSCIQPSHCHVIYQYQQTTATPHSMPMKAAVIAHRNARIARAAVAPMAICFVSVIYSITVCASRGMTRVPQTIGSKKRSSSTTKSVWTLMYR